MNGHTEGINWITFLPSNNFVTAANAEILDWLIKENEPVNDYTYKDHHNVTRVVAARNRGCIVSSSEDGKVCLYDCKSHRLLHEFHHEGTRFLSLIAHPSLNLYAAGYDKGLLIAELQSVFLFWRHQATLNPKQCNVTNVGTILRI